MLLLCPATTEHHTNRLQLLGGGGLIQTSRLPSSLLLCKRHSLGIRGLTRSYQGPLPPFWFKGPWAFHLCLSLALHMKSMGSYPPPGGNPRGQRPWSFDVCLVLSI